jgi:hypothetical protein
MEFLFARTLAGRCTALHAEELGESGRGAESEKGGTDEMEFMDGTCRFGIVI